MRRELTIAELEAEHTDLLPARETLSYGGNNNWATIVASNSSLALNAASLFASANSAAVQSITVNQG